MLQTKLCEKSCICAKEYVLKGFSLGCFSGQRTPPQMPNMRSRGHPPGLHQPQLRFSAPCFVFPLKVFKGLIFVCHRIENTSWNVRSSSQATLLFFLTGPGLWAVTLCLPSYSPRVVVCWNSCILYPVVNLELKQLGNCTAAVLGLICQCRVCRSPKSSNKESSLSYSRLSAGSIQRTVWL